MFTADGQKYYPDTNFFWGIGQSKTLIFLDKCREKEFSATVCEVVLWEHSRRLYQSSFVDTKPPSEPNLSDYQIGKILVEKFATQKHVFKECKIKILQMEKDHRTVADAFIQSGAFNVKDPNDLRDAHILSAAICECDPIKIKIICSDGNLRKQFKKNGFDFLKNIGQFSDTLKHTSADPKLPYPDFQEILRLNPGEIISTQLLDALPVLEPKYGPCVLTYLESVSKPETHSIQTNYGNLNSWLDSKGMEEREIRTRILGYSNLGDPAPKDEIVQFLKADGFSVEKVKSNIALTIQEGILEEIGILLVPNKENHEGLKICEEAGYSILEEFMQKVEGA